MLKNKNKIFNLGLPKTGTSSFIYTMQKLNFRTKHWDKDLCNCLMKHNYDKIFECIKKNDVFSDFPWASIYKEINEKFPGSKFLLIKRKPDEWLSSCLRYFDEQKNPNILGGAFFREYFFGSQVPKNNENKYLRKFIDHQNEVEKYFFNKKNFISIDIRDWKKACCFLKIPIIKFEYVNKSN